MQFKRSIINSSLDTAKEVIKHFGISMPGFSEWKPGEWQQREKEEYEEIKDCMLGWDVTDFGSNDFENIGRVLFTLRNGRKNNPKYPKEYAEKLLIDPENQRAPAHYHLTKREDIICRAGGNILVQLTKADENGKPSGEAFTIQVDGCTFHQQPAAIVRLKPGMSLCIPPRTIHQFWGEEGTGYKIDGIGYTVSSEVSSVCDDLNDNVFLENFGVRFPVIIEDEPKRYFLCNEYP
ncbi:MAG: D-lyxose/D-mannose family sugar isomerase [Chitinophagaceae bacterium]